MEPDISEWSDTTCSELWMWAVAAAQSSARVLSVEDVGTLREFLIAVTTGEAVDQFDISEGTLVEVVASYFPYIEKAVAEMGEEGRGKLADFAEYLLAVCRVKP